MSRLIEIVSSSNGQHHLEIGMNSNEISDFEMMLWVTHYHERAMDWMEHLGMGCISFMGGDLWIHNSDAVPRANFYGEQKDFKIGIVMNENPTESKVLDSIAIDSNGKWEVESITLPATLNYPQGMNSKVPKEHFKRRGSIWQAKFLRNMNTNQSTASVLDAIRGEELRGEEAYLVLKNVSNSGGTQIKLFKVELNLTKSRG